MSKPVENSIKYESGEVISTFANRKYTLKSIDGLLKIETGLAQ